MSNSLPERLVVRRFLASAKHYKRRKFSFTEKHMMCVVHSIRMATCDEKRKASYNWPKGTARQEKLFNIVQKEMNVIGYTTRVVDRGNYHELNIYW